MYDLVAQTFVVRDINFVNRGLFIKYIYFLIWKSDFETKDSISVPVTRF